MNLDWGWDNGRALLGIVLIYGVCWLLSESKRKLPWRIILGATAIQVVFALALYGVPFLRVGLQNAGFIVDQLQAASRAGTDFVFGWIGNNEAANSTLVTQVDASGAPKFLPPLFFFQILPLIIVVAALSAILWHWHILRWVTKGFALIFSRTMGLGGATSLAVSANVFMGMTEAPVLIKPYIPRMSRSEVFIVMTAGFATIAGSVLVIYVTFLSPVMDNPLPQLLVASLMAAPAAVAVALTIVPETVDIHERASEPDFEYHSTMDAFATGASDGMKIVLNIATMLIAALALLYIVNAILGAFPPVWDAPLSLQRILGWLFAPLMYMMGVPIDEAAKAGSILGVKTVLTEFVAFIDLSAVPVEEMSDRTRRIVANAVCGFANFGSVGILIGGLTIIAPEKREVFLSLAWKTLIAGTLATCLSGAIVGLLPASLFAG
ncbi:MAG: nucleoside transporter C-terminal domain-containing protein [Hyphomonadaceae bacterium]